MKHYPLFRVRLSFTLLVIAIFVPLAHSESTVLLAESAEGGVISQAESGSAMVSLPPKTSPTQGYSWKLPQPLPPGWWEMSVDFVVQPNDSLRLKFFIGSALQPVFDLSEADIPADSATFKCRFWSATPVTALEVRPQRTMGETVRAIRQVKLDRVDGIGNEAESLLVEAPVSATGAATLPRDLPAGNWQILPHFTKGKAPETGNVIVTATGHEKIAIPQSGFMNFYAAGSPQTMTWQPPAESLDGAVLRFILPYHPGLPTKPKQAFLPLTVPDAFTDVPLTLTFTSPPPGALPLPSLPTLSGNAKVAIITAWDDSPRASDLRMAQLLEKHGFRGTFFVMAHAPTQKEYLLELESRGMEVASHTVNHPRGWLISPTQWAQECLQMRVQLEEVLGHPIISFAYPFNYLRSDDASGDYVLRGVKEAGYLSARTIRVGEDTIDSCKEPLILVNNGHFRLQRGSLEKEWAKTKAQPGGIFYFWGHTWEIHSDQEWQDFENLLVTFEKQPDTWYATQGQVFLWKWLREHAAWTDVHESRASGGTELHVSLRYPKLDRSLQRQIPVTIVVPPGVFKVKAGRDGVELPVVNGMVTVPQGML